MKAARVMTRDVHCIEPQVAIAKAWELMQKLRVRHLPVVWDGKLVGIMSDRDLLVRGTLQPDGQLSFGELTCSDAMTKNPVSVPAATPVSQIASLMLQYRIDSVPIVDLSNHLVGLITSTDLIELLTEPEQVSEVLPFSFALRSPSETMTAA